MFKLTPVSSALAALMAASVLTGCAGGDVGPVAHPTGSNTTPSSDSQTTVDPAAKARAAALVATAQAARAVKARADAKANPSDPAAAQAVMTADAAVAYWRIITTFNLANAAFAQAVHQRGSAPAVPASFRAASRAFSAAHAEEAAELRAYGAWPQSVKPWIDQFIGQKKTLAGYHLQMAASTEGWPAWDKLDRQSILGGKESARFSALIRDGLGLPPRG